MHEKSYIYDEAVTKFGIESRLHLMQEEAAELIAAINQHLRGRCGVEHVLEEMGDTYIMLMQMAVIFGHKAFDDACYESKIKLQNHRENADIEREDEAKIINLHKLEKGMIRARKVEHEHD